jgi:hypothetical protein
MKQQKPKEKLEEKLTTPVQKWLKHNLKEKLEAKLTTPVQKWLKHNLKGIYAWEVKAERSDKFYYSSGSFKKELIDLKIFTRCFIYKFPDTGWGTPFDGITINIAASDINKFQKKYKPKSYLIIFFTSSSKKKFYIIDIFKIDAEINCGKLFLTEPRAIELADFIGVLGVLTIYN